MKLALSNVKGVSLPAAEVAGAHAGTVCSATARRHRSTTPWPRTASLCGVTASPEPERMHVNGSKIQVRFTRHERVHIRVRGDDGELKISVDEKIRCDDAPPPSVNTEVAPDAIRPTTTTTIDATGIMTATASNDGGHRGGNGPGGNGSGGGRDDHRGGDD